MRNHFDMPPGSRPSFAAGEGPSIAFLSFRRQLPPGCGRRAEMLNPCKSTRVGVFLNHPIIARPRASPLFCPMPFLQSLPSRQHSRALPLVLGLVLMLAPTTRTDAQEKAWNVRNHLKLEDIIVQSHRGAGVLAEEGTLEAFELGWKLGTYPEADLRATSDGVIVTFHDNTFARVVKDASPELKKKGVQDLTYAELALLDVGAWKGEAFRGRRVLPMATVFEIMRADRRKKIYMDVKKIEFKPLAAEVRRQDVAPQIVLASPNPDQLREWKTLVPESETLLWMHGNEAKLAEELTALRATKFKGVTQVQIHVYPKETTQGWAPPADATPPGDPFRLRSAFLRETGDDLRAHRVLFQVFPWTDDPKVIPALLDLGVMSFATDHPDTVMREIRAYYGEAK